MVATFRASLKERAMMPADLLERVWEVFAHGGDFQPIAGCNPAGCNPIAGCNENSWEIIGLQEIPVGLSAILESPQYAPHILQVAASEKRLNSEAEALHGQLYGNDYYPHAMRHQLLARYHQIEAHRRIRGLCPLSRAGREPTEDFR
jgi:hypothetical protein